METCVTPICAPAAPYWWDNIEQPYSRAETLLVKQICAIQKAETQTLASKASEGGIHVCPTCV